MRRYLHEYATEELVAELASRREGPRQPEVTRFCDQCANFKAHEGEKPPPKDFNACTKGHAMTFRMPEGYRADGWGFYRRGCKEWSRNPPPPPPGRQPRREK